jgi:hypothetical protein
MKALAFAIVIALPAAASAQTGQDLFKLCSSAATQEKMACDLYVAGFLHGLQALQDMPGTVCLPAQPLSGAKVVDIYLRHMSEAQSAQRDGKSVPIEQNPFFTAPQSHSLFAVLAMTFPCPKK